MPIYLLRDTAAKLMTTVHDCVSKFVSMRNLDIYQLHLWRQNQEFQAKP